MQPADISKFDYLNKFIFWYIKGGNDDQKIIAWGSCSVPFLSIKKCDKMWFLNLDINIFKLYVREFFLITQHILKLRLLEYKNFVVDLKVVFAKG